LTDQEKNDILALAKSLHPLERQILVSFPAQGGVTEAGLLRAIPTLQPAQLSMALGWLQAKEILQIIPPTGTSSTQPDEVLRQDAASPDLRQNAFIVSLTESGQCYAQYKCPPLRMIVAIEKTGTLPIRELQQRTDMNPDEISEAIGLLKKSGAVKVGAGGVFEMTDRSKLHTMNRLQKIIERVGSLSEGLDIKSFSSEDQELILFWHRKRSQSKGIFRMTDISRFSYEPTDLGREVIPHLANLQEEMGLLTPEILKEGSWHDRTFRKYYIQLPPPRISAGQKNPYRSFLDRVKQKFVALGFSEMRGPLIESEFWNMDALYMPQFHPAREIHDVYFVKGFPIDQTIPPDLVERVAATHQDGGGAGSRGWQYQFDAERTRRLILRSQGTAVSARTLAHHPNVSGKYFSMARCFRYDQVDATHAPDFFQVEGIVLGETVHFQTLLGLLTLFANEIARTDQIKFLPAYFPFTEPSVEMHICHPTLGWIELGGAGLFRPEVTGPLGVTVPVIAWGLGLDRMAMVAMGLSDIRDLFTPDLSKIRENRPVSRGEGGQRNGPFA